LLVLTAKDEQAGGFEALLACLGALGCSCARVVTVYFLVKKVSSKCTTIIGQDQGRWRF
jgi:hypothetical protein